MNAENRNIRILAQWLKEYELNQALETMDVEWNIQAGEKNAVHTVSAQYDDTIEPGQIRLVSRSLTPQVSRPLYVAVLQENKNEPGVWLAAPFGAYSVPGLPGEIFLRQGGSVALRVLCFWNRRYVTEKHLTGSWLVDALSATEQQICKELLNLPAESDPLKEISSAITGPPVLRTDDPRHQYISQEKHILENLVRCGSSREDHDKDGQKDFFYSDSAAPLKMVAEKAEKYSTNHKKPEEDQS